MSGHEEAERSETEHGENTAQVDRDGAEKDCEMKKGLRERDWRERGFREKWLIVNGRRKSGPRVNGTTTKYGLLTYLLTRWNLMKMTKCCRLQRLQSIAIHRTFRPVPEPERLLEYMFREARLPSCRIHNPKKG